MKIFIVANEIQKKEILSGKVAEDTLLTFAPALKEPDYTENYNAIFILSSSGNIDFERLVPKPVYINRVISTLSELNVPENVSRINGWPGFLERAIWEIVSNVKDGHDEIFAALSRKIIIVKDEPGLVSARVISMIVNEAFFAFGEKISSVEEIDMAMKLGTNYPTGPFEWAEKIGIENIYLLLQRLAEKEERYQPAPALKNLYLEISERVNQ